MNWIGAEKNGGLKVVGACHDYRWIFQAFSGLSTNNTSYPTLLFWVENMERPAPVIVKVVISR